MFAPSPGPQFIRKVILHLIARPSVEIAARLPGNISISTMKRLNGLLLSAPQILAITHQAKQKAPCNMLIFGLGFDSLFWAQVNRGGLTLFLEDDPSWTEKITRKSKLIKAYAVDYGSKKKDWEKYLANPELNRMELPKVVTDHRWDLILVDGPAGWDDESPGRMKSIYHAARLVKPGGEVFVHDCDRAVEDVFSDKFLGRENLLAEINFPQGLLRHYRIPSPRPLSSLASPAARP